MPKPANLEKPGALMEAPPKPENNGRMVKFTIVNLVDHTVDGKIVPEMEFHFRPLGAPPGEMPVKYRVLMGGKINQAPREVVEHLKTRAYDKYEQHKDPDTGEVSMVRVGSAPRFMVSEVG